MGLINFIARIFRPQPKLPHKHDWKEAEIQKHFWGFKENGKTYGMYFEIGDLIDKIENGGLSKYEEQVRQLQYLKECEKAGFTKVRLSWKLWRCECGKTCCQEFYNHPTK